MILNDHPTTYTYPVIANTCALGGTAFFRFQSLKSLAGTDMIALSGSLGTTFERRLTIASAASADTLREDFPSLSPPAPAAPPLTVEEVLSFPSDAPPPPEVVAVPEELTYVLTARDMGGFVATGGPIGSFPTLGLAPGTPFSPCNLCPPPSFVGPTTLPVP